mgnify:FL=1
MKILYNQNLRTFSKQLRNNSTIGEVMLWSELKRKKLGFQFMRQKPIMGYIVDFYCSSLKLAIEIDGSSHDTKIEADVLRQKEIEKLGINFLRFSEEDVRNSLDGVVREVKAVIQAKTTPASKTRHPLY